MLPSDFAASLANRSALSLVIFVEELLCSQPSPIVPPQLVEFTN
jgi:hypothetical protein